MYTFAVQDQIGERYVEAFCKLLEASGFEENVDFGLNPANHTSDPSRADFDVWVRNLLVEVKGNPAAAKTGNVVLEVDILETSKSHYFLIVFPTANGWHGRVLYRLEVERLLNHTTFRQGGRSFTYRRVPAGQFGRLAALVPIADLMLMGQPVDEWVAALTRLQ